mgnify:CR=1 FL=1
MSRNPNKLNRRHFHAAVGASVIGSGVFVNPAPAQESTSPNERLNLAAIGVTGDFHERANQLYEAGSRIICIDVAHGHHSLVKIFLLQILVALI